MSKYLNKAYTLRISDDLKARIAESAQQLNRSINADILARLEQSFSDTEKTDLSSLLAEIRELRLELRNIRLTEPDANS